MVEIFLRLLYIYVFAVKIIPMPRPKTATSKPSLADPSDELRVLDPEKAGIDEEPTLRPRHLSEYVGQTALKESLLNHPGNG